MRKPKLVVPPGEPFWPVAHPEKPWGLPAVFWNVATPWAFVRIYGHVGERVLYQLWWWSRGPMWWLEDSAASLDWRIQGKVKRLHEERVARSRKRRAGSAH